jgi:hypothetical protein
MTVYLHCEGVTDYAVIPILMKKAGKMPDLEIKWVKRDELKKMRTHRKSDIVISGHHKMIKALAVIAEKNGCKHIAYHQDADGKYADVLRAIKSEFDELHRFHCLAIVPKEMIESWLLADESAYPSIPKLPREPEEIWGQKSDPNSDHPYNYFVRVLAQFRLPDNRDTYTEIAENTGIEVLKRRCPKSFCQFYTDMQSFITAPSVRWTGADPAPPGCWA